MVRPTSHLARLAVFLFGSGAFVRLRARLMMPLINVSPFLHLSNKPVSALLSEIGLTRFGGGHFAGLSEHNCGPALTKGNGQSNDDDGLPEQGPNHGRSPGASEPAYRYKVPNTPTRINTHYGGEISRIDGTAVNQLVAQLIVGPRAIQG